MTLAAVIGSWVDSQVILNAPTMSHSSNGGEATPLPNIFKKSLCKYNLDIDTVTPAIFTLVNTGTLYLDLQK